MRLDKSYRVEGIPWSVSFSGHHHLFVASSDGAYLYPNESHESLEKDRGPHKDQDQDQVIQLIHPCPVTEGSISRLGHVVATASIDSMVRIYKPARRQRVPSAKPMFSPPRSPSSPHHQHQRGNTNGDFNNHSNSSSDSNNGEYMVHPVLTIGSNNRGNSSHVSLSADGRMCVISMTTGRYSGYVELLDWEKNVTVAKYSTAFAPGRVAISDDLRTLLVEWASAVSCGISLICAHTGKLLTSWVASSNGDFASALDAAGETVVLADKTNLSIHLLDGSCVTCESYQPPERGSFVDITRCGRKVGAIMAGGTIGIWNAEDGCLLHKLEGHRGVLSSISLSNDVLASCGFDRTILVHKLADADNNNSYGNGRLDLGALCEKRFRGRHRITPHDAVKWIRALIAKTGAAFHVPAADVDEIVEFAVRHTKQNAREELDGGIKQCELIACARRVIVFLCKCSHESNTIVAPD